MPDNEFIPELDCAESPWSATGLVNENCQDDSLFSEVKYLLIADGTQDPAIVPADWEISGVGGWADVIDNTNATGTKIKQILGVGNVAFTAGTPRQVAARREIQTPNSYALTFDILFIDDEMYAFLQKLESSNSMPPFWFVTTGGIMFGAPTGIIPKSKQLPFNLERGLDGYEQGQIILTWESRTRPLRIVSPV